jgi:SNF2 family DNA or RNA helicase
LVDGENMEIGSQVISKIYQDYGIGKIVDINTIGEETYCEVFFTDKKEVLTLNMNSLTKFTSNLEKMETRDHNNPLLFNLSILSEKIKALSYQDKIISANNFNIIPLPHQILTVNRVLEDHFPRFLIADEVGLGKTIEAGLVFEELKLRGEVKRILILCPAGLTNQWKDELKTKFNEDFLIMNRESFHGLSYVYGENNIWLEHSQVIASIDFIKPKTIKESLSDKTKQNRLNHNKNVFDNLVNGNWDIVIIDEAHNLTKNIDGFETAKYKAGDALASNTPMLLLLTATPHQGKTTRFRHLLELIDPIKFFDDESVTLENVESVSVKNEKRAAVDLEGNLIFKDRIVHLVEIERDSENIETLLYNKVSEYVAYYHYIAKNSPIVRFMLIMYQKMVSSSSRAIHDSLLKRYNLLTKNSKSLEDFAKSDFDEIDDFETQEAYDNIIKYVGSETDINDVNFTTLKPHIVKEMKMVEKCLSLAKKAITGRQDIKITKLLEIIDDVIKREGLDTKFIIFTEFIKTQEYIGEILEDFGYKVAYFNGNLSLDEKIAEKTKFKEDHQFLVSTDAGGEGINLQFAHVMINYDLPWNPMKIEQRIGRVDRIGQNKDVLVFNFVIKDTIEEHIRDILDAKLDIISNEFGDDKKRDVLSLLSGEYNFDRIVMEAIKAREVKTEQLQNIGNKMYNQAKNIIESQQLLIPFSNEESKLQNFEDYMIDDERVLVEKLVKSYLKYKNIELIEYSKKKNTYYISDSINGEKYNNLTFDKNISLDNEKYNYINLSHPLVKTILDVMSNHDSLSFDLRITNYEENIDSKDIKGTLFLYNL